MLIYYFESIWLLRKHDSSFQVNVMHLLLLYNILFSKIVLCAIYSCGMLPKVYYSDLWSYINGIKKCNVFSDLVSAHSKEEK